MMSKIRVTLTSLLAATLAAAILGLPQLSIAAAQATGATSASPAAGDAAARLNKKQYRDVKVTVDNGIATLSGTVDLYEYKIDAAKRILKAKGVTAVRNLIEVAGPTIPDSVLQAKLGEKLEYDRVGYWNVFDAISLNVQNGVATLGGHALDYMARDSALALVSTYPGVKDVIDEIQVDPTSPMDDGIRIAEYRSIYGFPSLNKYAIDPAKTIRITVQNGNVELDGVVDSQADKDIANLRANAVSGVFSVKNNLQVANQPSEPQK
ncbi:MAG: BON domain-containing protein [Terracidiphilus sp.]|jgi:osmotically-inducible protein OsmY